MLLRVKSGKLVHEFVLTRVDANDVRITFLDMKRKVYLHPHFSAGPELRFLLDKYGELYPWSVTDAIAEEVMNALSEDVINFLCFAFNAK